MPTPASTGSSPAISPSRGRSRADQLTWTFKLRPGVTWHDGEPFTANDVKFTIELCYNAKNTMAPCALRRGRGRRRRRQGIQGRHRDRDHRRQGRRRRTRSHSRSPPRTRCSRPRSPSCSSCPSTRSKDDPARGDEGQPSTGRRSRSGPVRSSGPSTRPASRPSSPRSTTTGAAKPKLDGIIRRHFQDVSRGAPRVRRR